MKPLKYLLLFALAFGAGAIAQEPEGELAKIKERELEEVRDRISALKKSMDDSTATRDQLTADLQKAEVAISEKRIRLKELERERDYSTRRRAELDGQLSSREAELDEESSELAEQVRAAYMRPGNTRPDHGLLRVPE
jgi:septal ring factor EnvC (AmiA/AmiB activator)